MIIEIPKQRNVKFYHDLPLFIRVHTTLLASMCPAMPSIIKFPYNARSDWLKQRALSEIRERVDDIKLAFKFLLWNLNKFDPHSKTIPVRLRQNQYKQAICQQ